MNPEHKLDKEVRIKIIKYLEAIANADERIQQLQMEIERLEQVASGCGAMRYDKERVQSSPQNTTEDNIIKLAEARHNLELTKSAMAAQRAEGYEIISKLGKDEYNVINDMYFKNIPLKKISAQRHYSLRTAQRIYSKALKDIADIMDARRKK